MAGVTDFVMLGPMLYGRVYSLAVQTGPNSTNLYGNENDQQSPLRVAFEIERSATGMATAKLALFNLTVKNRSAIRKGIPVRLRAGYVGLIDNLFIGTVAKIKVERQGPDVVTSMECVDAEPYVCMSVLDKPYAPGTKLLTILRDVASAMGTSFFSEAVQVTNGIINGIPNFTYQNGFTAHGPIKEVLDKLLRPRGLEWSVRNGALHVNPKTGFNLRPLLLLNRDTGLINVPSDNGKAVSMQSLLNPKLQPNALVQLASANTAISGVYKIQKAKYTGDSHDASWVVEMEGRRFTQSIEVVRRNQISTYAGGLVG